MSERLQSFSKSKPSAKIEIVNRTGTKTRFAGCQHKSWTTLVVRFWDREKVSQIRLPQGEADKCITCRIPQLREVEACANCDEPLLGQFGINHVCTAPKRASDASSKRSGRHKLQPASG